MGFLDRVKKLFGSSEDDEAEADAAEADASGGPSASRSPSAGPSANAAFNAARRERAKGRPPLAEAPPPSQSVEDALTAREAGRNDEARKILIEIDRGGGLRAVLRAAAALEANDAADAREALPRVASEEPRWRLALQVAAALGDPAKSAALVEQAKNDGAPAWALAWASAVSDDEAARRAGLVELLFADAALARTVAARDLHVPGAVSDPDAGARYAAFAHGRDSIRRFGADLVADALRAARAPSGGPR